MDSRAKILGYDHRIMQLERTPQVTGCSTWHKARRLGKKLA